MSNVQTAFNVVQTIINMVLIIQVIQLRQGSK